MQRSLKRFVRCCALLLCCAGHARASFQEPDSVYPSSAVVADSLHVTEDDADPGSVAEESDEPTVLRTIIYNDRRPTDARWLEATSDDAYTYRTKQEYVKRPPEPPQPDPAWLRTLNLFFMFFLTTPGKILLWSLLILIVGYIIYRVVAGEGGLFGKRDIRPGAALETGELTEDGLMELNWDARMREALAAGDQRSAIRFGYLHVLQQLQARELIRFRPEKTNIAYYRELTDTYRPGFRDLTRVYEFAWYGGFLPDAGGMAAYLANLEQFLQSIPRI